MKSFTLQTHGYYLDKDRSWMSSSSGLYFVYKGKLDKENNRAILLELIYIGEAANINAALENHPRRSHFLASCRQDELLFYSYAEYQGTDDERKAICSSIVSVILPSYNSRNATEKKCDVFSISIEGPHAYIPSLMSIGV